MKFLIALTLIICFTSMCLLAACESTSDSGIKPCFMVCDTLYYLGSGEPVDSLPDGYLFVGTLKSVRKIPADNLTGLNCAEDSKIYISEASPDTAYLYSAYAESYICFTVIKLQWDYIMVKDELYIREDHYEPAFGVSAESVYGDFNGILPEDCKNLGDVESYVSDALPATNFQTNFKNFVKRYSVYANDTNKKVIYITSDANSKNGIRFIKCNEGDL